MKQSGCLSGSLPPCLKPAGWEFQSDYTTQPAAAKEHFHIGIIRHKPALEANSGSGMRAYALFDLERRCFVVLIERIGFVEVFKRGTGALGSPLVDELGRRVSAAEWGRHDTTPFWVGLRQQQSTAKTLNKIYLHPNRPSNGKQAVNFTWHLLRGDPESALKLRVWISREFWAFLGKGWSGSSLWMVAAEMAALHILT